MREKNTKSPAVKKPVLPHSTSHQQEIPMVIQMANEPSAAAVSGPVKPAPTPVRPPAAAQATPPVAENIQPKLLDAPSTQPTSVEFVRTAQLFALIPFASDAGIDEGFLRNRTDAARPNPRTGAPWIPKPHDGSWNRDAALAGLAEWFWYQGQSSSGFPETFATQRDFTASTGLPLSLLEYLRKKGAPVLQAGGRVDFRAVLKAVGTLGVEQMDYIDGDYEDKRLTRERAEEQAMLNAEKRGEVLFSQDRQLAIGELQASEVLFEQFLAPFKKELLDRAKKDGFYDQITELLAKHLKHLPRELVEKSDPK